MAWFGIAATIGLVVVYFYAAFVRSLRERHPDVFRALGEPAVMPKRLRAATWAFTEFLWLGKFRRLEDRQLTRVGTLLIVSQVLFVLWAFWPLIVSGLIRAISASRGL